jgi:hypothetical protein
MKIEELGEVMAARELSLSEGDADPKTVMVRLGMPRQFPDSSSYYVPFQITGIGSEKIRYAGGVDAIQAIQLAMKTIGFYLNKHNDEVGGGLKWEAGDAGDFGFP